MDWKNTATRLLGNRSIHTEGDGQFTFVTPCRDRAFSLWSTRAEAEQVMNRIMSCGGNCLGVAFHYIVDLGAPKNPTSGQPYSRQDEQDVKQTAKLSVC
jgi:hypothetical protein